MSRSADDVTRVTRFVFRVLGDGFRFKFLAFPDENPRHSSWFFGVKCCQCGAALTKQITENALEDSMDMGYVVDADIDAAREPKARKA